MITSDLLKRVKALTWVYAIDLCDGLVTPGMWGPPSQTIMRALNTIDFRGKKVLDSLAGMARGRSKPRSAARPLSSRPTSTRSAGPISRRAGHAGTQANLSRMHYTPRQN
jgi:hypothetical protein